MSVQEFFGMRDPVVLGHVCWLWAGSCAIFLNIINGLKVRRWVAGMKFDVVSFVFAF